MTHPLLCSILRRRRGKREKERNRQRERKRERARERERSTTTTTRSPTNDLNWKVLRSQKGFNVYPLFIVRAVSAQKRLVGLRVAALTQISSIGEKEKENERRKRELSIRWPRRTIALAVMSAASEPAVSSRDRTVRWFCA